MWYLTKRWWGLLTWQDLTIFPIKFSQNHPCQGLSVKYSGETTGKANWPWIVSEEKKMWCRYFYSKLPHHSFCKVKVKMTHQGITTVGGTCPTFTPQKGIHYHHSTSSIISFSLQHAHQGISIPSPPTICWFQKWWSHQADWPHFWGISQTQKSLKIIQKKKKQINLTKCPQGVWNFWQANLMWNKCCQD